MENNLAVLIDFENIAAGTEKEGMGRMDVNAVFRRLKDKGRIVVARAFADWGRFSRFKQTLLEQGVTMVELTSHGMQDKNRADIALAVDAMELAFTRDYVDTFVLLSGDSDFTPLVLRLKELNKRVIGLGTRGSTSRLIVAACDEFIYYNTIQRGAPPQKPPGRTKEAEAEPEADGLDLPQALALLDEALRGLQQDDPRPVLASVVKAAILRKEPSFNESDLGCAGFARFLELASKRNVVSISREKRSGGYQVDTPNGESEQPRPEESARAQETAPALPPMSQEATRLRELLAGEGLNPLTRPIRKELVKQVADIVEDRSGGRKRVNLHVLRSELVRRARQDEGSLLSPDRIRAFLRALRESGVLLHADGTPVRSDGAQFTLQPAEVDGILEAMDQVYVRAVGAMHLDRVDTSALAELLLDDEENVQRIEELLAWASMEDDSQDDGEDDTDGDTEARKDEAGDPAEQPVPTEHEHGLEVASAGEE